MKKWNFHPKDIFKKINPGSVDIARGCFITPEDAKFGLVKVQLKIVQGNEFYLK